MDSLRHVLFLSIIIHTNIKLINLGRLGLFVSIPTRVRAKPVFGMAEPEAAKKDSREGSPSAGFFLFFCYSKVPEIETPDFT